MPVSVDWVRLAAQAQQARRVVGSLRVFLFRIFTTGHNKCQARARLAHPVHLSRMSNLLPKKSAGFFADVLTLWPASTVCAERREQWSQPEPAWSQNPLSARSRTRGRPRNKSEASLR